MNRRDLLASAGLGVIASTVVNDINAWADTGQAKDASPTTTAATLPKLPYDYAALEPHIDAQTMEIHYTKHHQAYVDGFNKSLGELSKARESGDFSLVDYWSKKVSFFGGGHYLHTMFWETMAPATSGGGGDPKGKLADKINADFGSFDKFKAQFSAAAKSVEGSGWALLHLDLVSKKLLILQAENQNKLSLWNSIPVLGIDVWEHAYYLKHQNKRDKYIESWWNVVNWSKVEENVFSNHLTTLRLSS